MWGKGRRWWCRMGRRGSRDSEAFTGAATPNGVGAGTKGGWRGEGGVSSQGWCFRTPVASRPPATRFCQTACVVRFFAVTFSRFFFITKRPRFFCSIINNFLWLERFCKIRQCVRVSSDVWVNKCNTLVIRVHLCSRISIVLNGIFVNTSNHHALSRLNLLSLIPREIIRRNSPGNTTRSCVIKDFASVRSVGNLRAGESMNGCFFRNLATRSSRRITTKQLACYFSRLSEDFIGQLPPERRCSRCECVAKYCLDKSARNKFFSNSFFLSFLFFLNCEQTVLKVVQCDPILGVLYLRLILKLLNKKISPDFKENKRGLFSAIFVHDRLSQWGLSPTR